MNTNHDIFLIGVGLNAENHLTIEAKSVLAKCRLVYHLTSVNHLLKNLVNGEVIDLTELYFSTRNPDIYKTIAEKVISAARQSPGVAFVCYGHPMVFVDSNQHILAEARKLELSVRIISGVSSIDILLERLQLDVGLSGLQIFEVNHMVVYQKFPNPTVACFIMQVGAFGTNQLTQERKSHPRRFEKLENFLLQVYPPRHPIVLITCSFFDEMPEIRHQILLEQLTDSAGLIHTGMTLYIPPCPPKERDQDFQKSLIESHNVFKANKEK